MSPRTAAEIDVKVNETEKRVELLELGQQRNSTWREEFEKLIDERNKTICESIKSLKAWIMGLLGTVIAALILQMIFAALKK